MVTDLAIRLVEKDWAQRQLIGQKTRYVLYYNDDNETGNTSTRTRDKNKSKGGFPLHTCTCIKTLFCDLLVYKR